MTSGAGAVKFKGHTNQGGRDITVRVGDDGLVDRVKFHRRLRCQPPLSDFSGTTTHSAPLDESTPTGFADKTRNTDHGGQVRVKSESPGRRSGHRVDGERSGQEQVPRASRIQPLQDGRDRLVGDARLLTRRQRCEEWSALNRDAVVTS